MILPLPENDRASLQAGHHSGRIANLRTERATFSFRRQGPHVSELFATVEMDFELRFDWTRWIRVWYELLAISEAHDSQIIIVFVLLALRKLVKAMSSTTSRRGSRSDSATTCLFLVLHSKALPSSFAKQISRFSPSPFAA